MSWEIAIRYIENGMRKIRNAYYFACWNRDYSHCSTGECLRIFFAVLLTSYITKKSIHSVIEDNTTDEDRENALSYIKLKNLLYNEDYTFLRDWYENERFYEKHGQHSSELSIASAIKRNSKYSARYKMGAQCWVNPGVHFLRQHANGTGTLHIGKQCLFGGNNKIDYTGDLFIGNGVVINEGVSILTHGHQYLGARSDYFDVETHAYYSPLTIEDNVVIGANATILANVKIIGENSIISAGAVVNRPVPANTLVTQTGMKPIPNGMRTLFLYKKED